MRQFLFPILISLCILSCARNQPPEPEPFPEALEKAPLTIPVGERMVFSIRWIGLEVGTAELKVEDIVQVEGRDAYHISLFVKSNKLIDLIYPVRHHHDSFMDVEHLHSLRYEKKVRQGGYRADEVMTFDQVSHTARYESRRSGTVKEMLIPEHVQDELSCTFWFRLQEMRPGGQVQIPVSLDEKNWDLTIDIGEFERLKIDGFGRITAIQVEPMASFQGLFVRKGRVWGWMSADERRIPLLMKTKVPVLGTINMVIKEYELGDYHVKA